MWNLSLKQHRHYFVFASVIFGFTAAAAQDSSAYDPTQTIDSNLVKLTPITFIDALKSCPYPFYVAGRPPANWIRREHIPILIHLLECSDSCATVQSPWSSTILFNRSTVANEAASLIMKFRRGVGFWGLQSQGSHYTESDLAEIREWYRHFVNEQ